MSRFPQGAELLPALQTNSRLPGPRANLELLHQFVAECDQNQADLCLATLQQPIPADNPAEFVAMCGVAASGKLLAQGQASYFSVIQIAARHASWRVREAAAMALQYVGQQSRAQLLGLVESWDSPTLLDKRCIAAALCEPALLTEKEFASRTLSLLDDYIVEFESERNTKSEDYKTLKKGLGYCLSVAVAANPSEGKERFEGWTRSPSNEVRWVLNENLKHSRLRRMDADWVDQQIEVLNDVD
jgi:hypothetical protein